MNVQLSGQAYYTNNPIYVNVTGIPLECMKITYSVISLAEISGADSMFVRPVEVYTNNRESLVIDVSKIAKLFLYSEPHNINYSTATPIQIRSNYRSLRLVFSFYDYQNNLMDSKSLSKRFLRGGKRIYTNNVQAIRGNLILTDKIPVWNSFPIDLYYLDTDYTLKKTNIIPDTLKDRMDVKGCNGLYIKFLNSKGGFSYWMFENFNFETSNKHEGVVRNLYDYDDLGSEVNSYTVDAISKVPRKYFPLIEDLIFSNEIYMYVNPMLGSGNVFGSRDQAPFWERIYSDNNKTTIDNLNSIKRFNLKFKRETTYNGTLLW